MGYLKDSYNMSIKPLLDFASPVITPIGNFLTSGSNYNPNESAASNFTTSFTTPSNLFDNTFMSDNMDLTYGGSEVPDMPIMPSDTALGPIYISNPQPSYLDDDTFMSDNMDLTYNSNEQINPAGVTSADGMMTEPAMYLYPGEAIGIDGVPYRPSAGVSTSNSGSSNGGGSTAVASAVPSAPVLRTRTFPFTSRTPSGSVYAPDLSAYNDSSLFNYAGPGGLAEYTYGQGLRTDGADYSIFGSPANIANPYFAGQFKEPQGPADAAINMPAVELPEGVQPVTPTEVSADVSMPAFNGITPRPPNSAGDLTYQQTIDEMGIFGPNNPPPSTLFPSPGQATANEQNTVAGNIAGTPDNSMMANQAAADAAMGNRMGYPDNLFAGASAMDDTADIERGILTSQRGTTMDDTADIEAGMSRVPTDMQRYLDDFEARGIRDRTAEIMDYAANNNRTVGGVTIFDEGDPRQIIQDAILNPETRREYKPVYGGIDGIPVELGPERSFFKADEIDIPTPPFRPEGVEGGDFYQDVTGNFFNMEDDLGTEPIVEPSMDSTFLNRETGTGDAISQTVLPRIEPFQPPRPDNDMTFGQAGRTAYDGRSAYEREGTEELTSGRMAYLDNAMSAINAKYAGSKTDASAEAELKEILNATLETFGNPVGRENAALAREQQSMRQANATPFIPSYARENEGQDTGESLFQNVAEDIPLSVFNPIDRVVMQAEAQAAQVAAAKAQAAADSRAAERAAAAAEARRNLPPPPPRVTPANVASIFSPPAGPPNMAQIKPMVARTQNNMTVPVMRDSAMDRRYGGPMRFGR
jgi:hypothetical protein